MPTARRSWLPFDMAQRLRREVVSGLALVVTALVGVWLVDVVTNPVTWQIDKSGAATLTDGTPCDLYRVAEVDDTTGAGVAMLDCGSRPATSAPVIAQQLLVAVGAAGVLLVVGGLLCRVLASRLPPETLRAPVIVLGLIAGVLLTWWGLRPTGEHLVYGVSDGVVSAVLTGGPRLDLRGAATAAGFGFVAASLVRGARP